MAYNPKLGAMSSPFGENPNAGSIMSEDPMKMPPDESKPTYNPNKQSVINSPSDIAKMFDDAYGSVINNHNNAQDKATLKAPPKNVVEPVVKTNPPPTQATAKTSQSKNDVLGKLIADGCEIKSVTDTKVVAIMNGMEVSIDVK